MQSLFERFGGLDNVARLAFAFYDRVLRSERLAPFFVGIDMRRLVDHQAKVLSSVMGGPASYTDEQLREVHAHLGVGGRDFDEMLALLDDSLREFGLGDDDADLVLRQMRAWRPSIVAAPLVHATA